jgi:cytochrome bd-type quinol oxidase subunit 2
MTDERRDEERVAEALLAEDLRARGTSSGAGAVDPWLTALLDREEKAERRVRRLARGGWAAVAVLVPLLAVAIFLIRVVDDGWVRDAVRAAVLVIGVFAILAIVVALLATVAWLFRSRSQSLAVIERRLAALEALLRGRQD